MIGKEDHRMCPLVDRNAEHRVQAWVSVHTHACGTEREAHVCVWAELLQQQPTAKTPDDQQAAVCRVKQREV